MFSGFPTRRDWLRMASLGAASIGVSSLSMSRWLPTLAAETAAAPARKKSCILLWMPGGPSQIDTFDPKPGHKNGGEFKPIDSSVPGIQISEHLPQLARQMEHLAIIRSMQTKEGDHGRATYHLRTGYLPQGPVRYPTLGSLVSHELGSETNELPNFVSIMPNRLLSPGAYGAGFLGPRYAPLIVGAEPPRRARPMNGQSAEDMPYGPPLEVRNIRPTTEISLPQSESRLDLLASMEKEFQAQRPGLSADSHQSAYHQAVRMMRSEAVGAFNLDEEPAELRAAYGKNRFGQACLLARRLVERGVPFIEVALSDAMGGMGIGWDTHAQNFEGVKALSGVLDPAWGTLMHDLQERGLLDSTLVVWMGEFGRTAAINEQGGRDHYPTAWTTVLGGGGIRGGQVYGRTDDGGEKVVDKPVAVPDLLATIVSALGINPAQENMSNVGRPIPLTDRLGKPLAEILVNPPAG
ncbi:MAG: DUF1501 domain-containing protein [Planctomycetota bacterium]|nr:MAG: DUF1501 domain-containing protein [Planctomycetota bacterium]